MGNHANAWILVAFSDNGPENPCTKPGLLTMDWTVDWTVDWTMDGDFLAVSWFAALPRI